MKLFLLKIKIILVFVIWICIIKAEQKENLQNNNAGNADKVDKADITEKTFKSEKTKEQKEAIKQNFLDQMKKTSQPNSPAVSSTTPTASPAKKNIDRDEMKSFFANLLSKEKPK